MWKWFHKADKGADIALRWIAVIGVATAALAWLSKHAPWFGELNWAGAILLGLAMTVACLFVISASLAMIRYFNPLTRSETQPQGPIPIPEFDQSRLDKFEKDLRQQAEKLDKMNLSFETVSKLNAEHSKAILDMVGEVNRRTTSADEAIREELVAHKKHMSDCYSAQDAARRKDIAELTRDLLELRRACAGLEDTVKANAHRTAVSFAAIQDRERLQQVAIKILEVAADMERRVQSGEKHDAQSWDSWDNNHAHWAELMREWWSLARFYLAAPSKIFTVSDRQYRTTEIPEHLFADVGGDPMRVFRQFRVIQAQWAETQDSLQENIALVAFSGTTESEVRHGATIEQAVPKIR